MKKYIVLTRGGQALDDSGQEVAQCLYLGTFYAPFPGAAIDAATWQVQNLEQDFSVDDMFAYELAEHEKI